MLALHTVFCVITCVNDRFALARKQEALGREAFKKRMEVLKAAKASKKGAAPSPEKQVTPGSVPLSSVDQR